MPEGADPLDRYVRYYSGEWVDGARRVRGVFLVASIAALTQRGGVTGIRVVTSDDLPDISDGGCGVIELEYDVASDHVISLACHGSA